MKKRIIRSFNLLNFTSLVILFFMVTLLMGSLFGIFSSLLSKSVANQIAMALSLNDKYEYERMGDPYTLVTEDPGPTGNQGPMNVKRLNLVRYMVFKSGENVYDSLNTESHYGELLKNIEGKTLLQLINKRSEAELKDTSKKVVGKVVVELNPILVYAAYIGLISVFGIGIIVIFVVSQLGVRFMGPVLIRPIEELEKKMSNMATGNIESALSTQITMKKPVYEMEILAGHANTILSTMNSYVADLEAQRSLLDQQNEKLYHIMNQVDQGILQVNANLEIESPYSQEAERILGIALKGIYFPKVLFPNDEGGLAFFEELLNSLFHTKSMEQEVLLSLLPEELLINNKWIHIQYKMVLYKDLSHLMVIMTDITEQRALKQNIEEEQLTLKMVVKSLVYSDALRMLIKSYESFSASAQEMVLEGKLSTVIREVHTFKGSFAQYDWKHTQEQLNIMEDLLVDGTQNHVGVLEEQALLTFLEYDYQKIIQHVGIDFRSESPQCIVDREKILRIEDRVVELLAPEEQNEILPMVRELRYVSLKTYLAQYEDYLGTLALRLEKSILLGPVTGDDPYIDPERFDPVLRQIVHLIRNSADHGIEEDVDRMTLGKPLPSILSFDIQQKSDWITIQLSDDGRGIQYDLLKEKALEKGYTQDEINNIPEHELPFLEGLSIKDEANIISGRGVGMSAVRDAIISFGGSIQVTSEDGHGTTYTLTLPLLTAHSSFTSSNELIKGLTETVDILFNKRFGIPLEALPVSHMNSIVLDEVTAIVHLKGTLNLIVMISITKELLTALRPHMIFYEVNEDDLESLLEDLLSELSNTVLGNALRTFDSREDIFHLGIPVIMSHTEGYIKYSQDTIVSRRFENGHNCLGIHLIPIHSEFIVKRFEEGK